MQKKILIAVPTFENICPETFKSIYGIQSEHLLAFDYCKGYDCAIARNRIAKEALEGRFDYVLMVDSDIIVPSDVLDHMLSNPVAVCVGVYPRKNTKSQQTELFKFTEKDFTERFTFSELNEYVNRVNRLPVKGSGLGCACIKTDVFQQLPYPWFKYVMYPDGDVLSEDLYFSDQLRKHEIQMMADPRIRCAHMTRSFQYQ